MIVIPTAELRGSFVYAPLGNHGRSAARTPVDADATHRAFTALGFRQIHLYDVDSDSGRDQNETLIAEIARDAGFGDRMRMYEVFRRELGVTPGQLPLRG